MKRLDTYLLRQFLNILAIGLLGFVTVFIVVDLIENLDRFIDNAVPIGIILKYYLFTLPWFVNIALPMATLIATVFSVGLMVKRNEWTAMKATGISLYRIAIPLILVGFVLSFISYQFDNNLVSWGHEKRYSIERKYQKKRFKQNRRILKDIFLQKKESTHIALSKYRINKKFAEGITIIKLEEGKLYQRLDAKSMSWVDSLSSWILSNYSIRTFNSYGVETNVMISEKDTLFSFDLKPEDISQKFKSPEELNYKELTKRIALLKENGVKTTRWEVEQYFKVSFAFTNLIVILFGLPLVVIKHKGGLSFGAGMSVFVIFGYYAFIKFGQSLGYKEVLDPLASAWIGNVVFSIGGLILLLFTRK